ncbi:Endonuclease-reverse transcriptase [Popillia japonica]|uniref:Endonuclease-reverse transcriptase n=1 Tax=Popillia japonica TaxID=7064 RepID=A0AAW1JWW4_POPJA
MHHSFGSSKNDNAGNILVKVIDEMEYVFLNDGSATRINRPGQGISAIDITLCTASLASKATWKVLDDSFTSDHYPILITLQFNRVLKGPRYPKYKWKIENERKRNSNK